MGRRPPQRLRTRADPTYNNPRRLIPGSKSGGFFLSPFFHHGHHYISQLAAQNSSMSSWSAGRNRELQHPEAAEAEARDYRQGLHAMPNPQLVVIKASGWGSRRLP